MKSWKQRAYDGYTTHYLEPMRGIFSLETERRHFPALRKWYRKHLPAAKDAAIADIGCGSGGFIYWLRKEGYTRVGGCDANPDIIREAEKKGITGAVTEDVFSFLARSHNTYDCIVARDIIEHFDKDEIFELLDAVFAALKPGGVFLAQTPNAENLFGTRYRYMDFTHETTFTKTSLCHVLRSAGFRDAECYSLRLAVHGIKSALRLPLWMMIEGILRFYLLVELGSAKAILTPNMLAVAKK